MRSILIGTWPWPITSAKAQPWNFVSATDHINVGIICYYGHEFPQYQKISNNCSTVRELFPIGRWAISTLVQFGCFSMRQGLDLGVRYSRISFLCLFRTDRPTYIISISKETTVLNKIKLILSKRNSNNDLDLEDHYLNPGIDGPKPVDPGPATAKRNSDRTRTTKCCKSRILFGSTGLVRGFIGQVDDLEFGSGLDPLEIPPRPYRSKSAETVSNFAKL